jgi:cytochrome P450
VIVIAELLGIPAADRDRFKQWSDAVVTGGRQRTQKDAHPQREMAQYLAQIIESRRLHPAEDLISRLLTATVDGKSLTVEEILGFAVLLLVAGNETTTNLIGNTLLCLNEFPEQQEYLRSHAGSWPGAIEEALRFRSPVQSMFRVAALDTDIRGQHIKAGDRVIAWIGSANRDEEQFPHAGQFDIGRSPNKHIAFGFGAHFCLGAPLARLEAQTALQMLVNPARSIRVHHIAPLEPWSSSIVYGVKHLNVTFEEVF